MKTLSPPSIARTHGEAAADAAADAALRRIGARATISAGLINAARVRRMRLARRLTMTATATARGAKLSGGVRKLRLIERGQQATVRLFDLERLALLFGVQIRKLFL
jgi:hypothetical protein